MDAVVRLDEWRRHRRAREPETGEPTEAASLAAHPAGTGHPTGLARLERAVDRLHELVSATGRKGTRLTPPVETELLAILGELTIDMVQEATDRAERLAERLASGKGIIRSGGSPPAV